MLLSLSLSSSPASSSSLSLLLSGVMFCMFFLFCFLRNVLHRFLVEVFIVITQDCVVDGEPGTYYFRLYDPLNVPRYAYGNHHGVLGISILLVKPICCVLFLQYFLDFCINSSFCETKLLSCCMISKALVQQKATPQLLQSNREGPLLRSRPPSTERNRSRHSISNIKWKELI